MIPRFVFLAIFLSGFASLGYELCWIRKGALLIGATPQALSIVVAVFFGGMAAGAGISGLISKRTTRPLFWYGMLECAIALSAVSTPVLFTYAGKASAVVSLWGGSSPSFQLLTQVALVVALILPPCILIGGTLPLLCQFSINTRQTDIRVTAGFLYVINTAGAFFGCMVCGLWLIPFHGIDAAIRCNALASCAAGAGILLLSRVISSSKRHEVSQPDQQPEPSSSALVDSRLSGIIVYTLFFLAGFTALGYEILWVRFLSLIIHNNIYTCIFSIGAILLGIAVGGWLVLLLKVLPEQDVLLFGAANIFIAFAVLIILLQPVASWDWIRNSRSVPMQALLCMAIILIPSMASGASFPLAYRMIAAHRINSGRDFGFLTAVSTLGGIVGSLLVGFSLLPALGMYATLIILTCVSLTIGTYAVFAFADAVPLSRRVMIASGATAGWFWVVLSCDTRLPEDFLSANRQMYECAEGVSSFISVVNRGGIKTLEIDRMWQGQNPKGHQILPAHIPMLLHQDPKNVLVIGIGTGQTASRFLMYDIERLDCVDIEKKLPGILQRHFDAGWLSDPRTHIVTADGRNFTSHPATRYDVISIEVGQAFRPQIASFYTVDFYRDVQKQLTNGGLACQFIPAGFFTEDEFKSVVHSFIEVFPQSTLWFNKYAELILVGNTTQQPKLRPERLALLQSDDDIRSDLEYSYDLKPAQLMNQKNVFAANFIMGPETLAKLAGNALLYNDDRPILEYQAARTLYLPGRFHELIENNLEQPDTIFARKIQLATGKDIARIRAENIHDMLSGERK